MKNLNSYKKIAKEFIKEAAWDRKFGEPLPTLEDVMKEAEVDAVGLDMLFVAKWVKPSICHCKLVALPIPCAPVRSTCSRPAAICTLNN